MYIAVITLPSGVRKALGPFERMDQVSSYMKRRFPHITCEVIQMFDPESLSNTAQAAYPKKVSAV